MKLKEIEMDLPYKENKEFIRQIQKSENLDYDEAVRRDYETNWKKIRRDFQLMTRCMTAMIERIMKTVNTSDCWKLLFECVDECVDNEYKNLLGVYVVQVSLNVADFFHLSDFDKKKIVINKVMEGINKISNKVPFETFHISKACEQIINDGYSNEWIWKKPLIVRERRVQIAIKHDVRDLGIYMVISDKSNTIMTQALIISTVPDERIYNEYLGELKQISENEVALVTKSGEMFVEICD